MKLIFSSTLTVLVILASGIALAQDGLQGGGDAQVTDSWTVTQGCGGCGPTQSFELFIVNDTGAGPFESPGLSTLPAGWAGSDINPNYVLGTGPAVNLSDWTEHYQGNIANSVRIDLIMWSGAPVVSSIAFAAAFTRRVNGTIDFSDTFCQSFGSGCPEMLHPDGIGYDRSPGTIGLDIKPGSDPNGVNPRSNGVIPVAVLGAADFDVMQVDPTTVVFGPDGASPVHNGHFEEVSDDGIVDLVLHFETQDTGIACGDTDATLTGETFDATPIEGTDTVKTAGCE